MLRKIGGFIALAVIIMILGGCQSNEDISLMLGADVSSGEVISKGDSHGGFHGDGERYLEFQFEDDIFEDTIKKDHTWHMLPLQDDTLEALLYGKTIGDIFYGPYLQAEMPEIEKGYYFFYDRHSESADPFDTSEVLGRSSMNFTVALYDTKSDILYFAELDT
ncbi:hypothetical protein [Anaerotignum sp.]